MRTRPGRSDILLLLLIDCLLTGLYLATSAATIPPQVRQLFDLNGEYNIPAIFSALQLALVGWLLLEHGRYNSAVAENAFLLKLAGAGFLFLAFDEGLVLHERITGLAGHRWWIPHFNGYRGVWIFVYLILGVTILTLLRGPIRRFCRRFPKTSAIMAFGAGIYVLGAVVLEIVAYQGLLPTGSLWWKRLQIAAEEWCEMSGVTIILLSVLSLPVVRKTTSRKEHPDLPRAEQPQ